MPQSLHRIAITVSLLGIAWRFASCTMAPPNIPGNVQAPAGGLYLNIKRTVDQIIRDEDIDLGDDLHLDEVAPGKLGNVIDLCYCSRADDLGFSMKNPWATAITIALHLEKRKQALARRNIPPAIFVDSFSSMERLAQLSLTSRLSPLTEKEDSEDGYFDRWQAEYDHLGVELKKKLNAYVQRHPGMLQFRYECGCGEGKRSVTITTTPPGGKVRYIPLFSYQLCQRNDVDPNDPEKCEGWVTAVSVKEDLIGKYRYVISWPDGKRVTDIMDISGQDKINLH